MGFQQRRGGVPGLQQRRTQAAGLQVRTVVAFAEGHLADAGRQGQRAVDHPDNLGETDVFRWPGKGIAAELAAAANDHMPPCELQQNGLQELAGRIGAQRQFAGRELGVIAGAGEFDQGAQRVSGLLRQHLSGFPGSHR